MSNTIGNIGNGVGNTIGNIQKCRSKGESDVHVASVANNSKDFWMLVVRGL